MKSAIHTRAGSSPSPANAINGYFDSRRGRSERSQQSPRRNAREVRSLTIQNLKNNRNEAIKKAVKQGWTNLHE
jgi:hypothetical protein